MRDPDCKLCPLYEGVTTVCLPAEGSTSAKLLVLLDAPDEDMDATGLVLAGRTGQVLRPILDSLGAEYRLTLAVRCRPPGNRKPGKTEWDSCSTYLDQDLREMPNLTLIACLGETACRRLGVKGKVGEMAGTFQEAPLAPANAKVFVMSLPGVLSRNPGYLSTYLSHWDVVRRALCPGDDPAEQIGAEILDHVELF